MTEPTTRYCYHCRIYHPVEEMRLVHSKSGSRWRCIKSIEVSKKSQSEREAFGKKVTAANSAEASNKFRMLKET